MASQVLDTWPPVLVDADLVLRPYEEGDAQQLALGFGDESITRWFPVGVPFTESHAAEFIARASTSWASREQATFAIVSATGELLGGVDVDDIDFETTTGEVGYWLRPEARGAGIATRAVRAVSDWAFHGLGLRRLTLLAEPENQASLRLADRAGFIRDRFLPDHDVDWRDNRSRSFWRYIRDCSGADVDDVLLAAFSNLPSSSGFTEGEQSAAESWRERATIARSFRGLFDCSAPTNLSTRYAKDELRDR